MKLAPEGIGYDKFRRSTNIEDNRNYLPGADSISRSDEVIQKTVDEAHEVLRHSLEPASPLRALFDTVAGKMKMSSDKHLRDAVVVDLQNAVEDYVKSGRLQAEIDAYHKSDDYKEWRERELAKKLDDIFKTIKEIKTGK